MCEGIWTEEWCLLPFRLFVPAIEINQIAVSSNSYTELVRDIPGGSLILLDVPEVSGNESVVANNVRLMSRQASEHGHDTYILNAFDPGPAAHNFGPYLAFDSGSKGFGDLATERQWPALGGGGYPTAIIRYYDFERHYLEEFRDPLAGYEPALQRLVRSSMWQNHSTHRISCPACTAVEQGDYQLSNAYWKRFRVRHYISSILNETKPQFRAVRNPQDLDPDGHEVVVRQGQTQSP